MSRVTTHKGNQSFAEKVYHFTPSFGYLRYAVLKQLKKVVQYTKVIHCINLAEIKFKYMRSTHL